MVVLPLVHRPTEALETVRRNQWWYWLHATNILSARGGLLLYNTGHFWSLAVEEQFYLIWPVVVWFVPVARLVKVCVVCVIAALIFRSLSELAGHSIWAIALTPARMDTLALGALLAVRARLPDGLRLVSVWAPWVGAIGIGVLLITFFGSQYWPKLQPLQDTLGFSACALGFAAVLALVISGWGRPFFAHPVLRFFGKYSYGMYVFHWPLLIFATPLYAAVALLPLVHGSSVLRGLAFFVVAMTASVVVAWLSWHLYEQRFLALKRFFPYKEPAGGAGPQAYSEPASARVEATTPS